MYFIHESRMTITTENKVKYKKSLNNIKRNLFLLLLFYNAKHFEPSFFWGGISLFILSTHTSLLNECYTYAYCTLYINKTKQNTLHLHIININI